MLQQPGLSHPGVVCATKQLPFTGSEVLGSMQPGCVLQRSLATFTQDWSQLT